MLYTWQRGDPISIDEQYGKPELNPFWHHSSKKPLAWIDHTIGDFLHYTRSRKWVWMFMVLEFLWYGFLLFTSFSTFRTVCPTSVNSFFAMFGFLFCQDNVAAWMFIYVSIGFFNLCQLMALTARGFRPFVKGLELSLDHLDRTAVLWYYVSTLLFLAWDLVGIFFVCQESKTRSDILQTSGVAAVVSFWVFFLVLRVTS